jgi:hypothetical protein
LLFANIKEKHKTYSYEIQYQSIHGGQQHDPTTGAVMPLFFKRQHLLKQVLENLLVIMATVVQQIPQEQL